MQWHKHTVDRCLALISIGSELYCWLAPACYQEWRYKFLAAERSGGTHCPKLLHSYNGWCHHRHWRAGWADQVRLLI